MFFDKVLCKLNNQSLNQGFMRNSTTIFHKLAAVIFIFSALIMAFPSRLMAAESTMGTIHISVVAENGENVSGNWYLHRGTTENGYLIRNGSFGETFQAEEGYYYLEVRGLASSRPYFIRYSKNPQFLYGGSSIAFSVKYFKTQEEMLSASGDPAATQVMETTSVGLETTDVYDIHGCNSTQGYVWCAKDQACTRFWSPVCKVSASQTPAEPTTSGSTAVTTVPSVSETSAVSGLEVPSFETPPANSGTVNINTAIEAENDIRLVQTGNSAVLLFIASMLLSLGTFRLFYTRRRHP